MYSTNNTKQEMDGARKSVADMTPTEHICAVEEDEISFLL
jgi:hypothetical protein